MVNNQGCTTAGEFTAGTASDAYHCAEVCETLNRNGCCEWQTDWQRCVFQPNDVSIVEHYVGTARFATMCTSSGTFQNNQN